jgi:hypothetical protein
MTVTSLQLAADLTDLKFVATVDVPMLAYTFARLNAILYNSRFEDLFAFDQSDPSVDPVGPAWQGMRDDLQDILGNTARVLDDVSAALLHVVDAYAASDHQAGDILTQVWRNGPPELATGEALPPGLAPTVFLSTEGETP